ncbi:MAG: hypothetical protein ACE5K4_01130 [Candidatus Hydrothermarchaeota archaeon]
MKGSGYMLFCPRCGSGKLKYAVDGSTVNLYKCRECGYTGSFVIEGYELAKEIRKKYLVKED